MTENMKKCPFCGSQPEKVKSCKLFYLVKCPECLIMLPIEKWNTTLQEVISEEQKALMDIG